MKWFFKAMRATFLLGKGRELLFRITSQTELWERKEYSFSHWYVLTSLCRDRTRGGNDWMLQITQESVYYAGIKFQQCWILFGIFFLQRISHVKLICGTHGSCSMGRKLIVLSVCPSPVPACIQGISDLLVIPEAFTQWGVVVFNAQNGALL